MVRMAWVLGRRRARQHPCCARAHQGCAVQALWGARGIMATTHASRNSEADGTRCCHTGAPCRCSVARA